MKRPKPITDVSCQYGAPRGRRENFDDPVGKLRLQYVPFVDGAYDQGGAYWGSPANLWVAFGEGEAEQIQVFTRAKSREEAKISIIAAFDTRGLATPKFYR